MSWRPPSMIDTSKWIEQAHSDAEPIEPAEPEMPAEPVELATDTPLKPEPAPAPVAPSSSPPPSSSSLSSLSPLSPLSLLSPLPSPPPPPPEPKLPAVQQRPHSSYSRSTAGHKPLPQKPRHPAISLLFGCLGIHSRPRYTKIQHIVLPTAQVCVDTRALNFLQSLPPDEFQLLEYMVQEVFTADGAAVLSRIPDYDKLIESALKGQINMTARPWDRKTREQYVEHVGAMYARLLRKMGTYEQAPMCEAVYRRRWRRKSSIAT
ncbi:hypothetical protein TWF696_006067 [Orbilia brochopaga]|uniref:Uncharacterized protein n=1 Tax=Orbilia brochopaga TaxID=3140254 RepID=A0AAV9UVP1_9PEZI